MTGWKTWAALEEVTAANMNSYVRDQTVQVFTNSASRSAAITSPTRGLVSLLTDTGEVEWYYGATTGWRPPWGKAWGVVTATAGGTSGLGYVLNTATQNITTTETALTSMTVTFTAVANRLYRACLYEPRLNNAGGSPGYFEGKLRFTSVAGTQMQSIVIPSGAGVAPVQMFLETVFTTSGSKVVLATLQTPSGNFNAEGSATQPRTFRVEDIGPATTTVPAA